MIEDEDIRLTINGAPAFSVVDDLHLDDEWPDRWQWSGVAARWSPAGGWRPVTA